MRIRNKTILRQRERKKWNLKNLQEIIVDVLNVGAEDITMDTTFSG